MLLTSNDWNETIVSEGNRYTMANWNRVIGERLMINREPQSINSVFIADDTNIDPGANIGGVFRIADRVKVSIGLTVIDHVQIVPVTLIGGDAVVTRDLPGLVLAFGVPTRIGKENTKGKASR